MVRGRQLKLTTCLQTASEVILLIARRNERFEGSQYNYVFFNAQLRVVRQNIRSPQTDVLRNRTGNLCTTEVANYHGDLLPKRPRVHQCILLLWDKEVEVSVDEQVSKLFPKLQNSTPMFENTALDSKLALSI